MPSFYYRNLMNYALYVFCTILCLSVPGKASETYKWYSYIFKGSKIGYAKVAYTFHKKDKLFYKQKIKVETSIGEYEKVSGILNNDYSVISADLRINTRKLSNSYLVTVNNRIIIKYNNEIKSFPKQKLFLEPSDFIRSLIIKKDFDYGKVKTAFVLSTSNTVLSKVKVRYLGTGTFEANLKQNKCHVFKVTTSELRNFWAKAHVDFNGDLIAYKLGDFQIIKTFPKYARVKRLRSIRSLFIFDPQSIKRLYLKVENNDIKFLKPGTLHKIKGHRIMLMAPEKAVVSYTNLSLYKKYLKSTLYIPCCPFLKNYVREIFNGMYSKNKNFYSIIRWIYNNLEKNETVAGSKLANFLGRPENICAVATVALCKNSGIPSRLVAGLYYEPGRFIYETWAEVYDDQWLPIYKGKIGKGARFFSIYENTSWAEIKKVPRLFPKVYKLIKKNKKISLNRQITYLINQNNRTVDKLLGVSFIVPDGWQLLSKNIYKDFLNFKLLKKQESNLFLRIFKLPKKPLKEILQSLAKKMSGKSGFELLWKQNCPFANGEGLEIAVKAKDTVFRIFIGQGKEKGCVALLITNLGDLKQIEPTFKKFTHSIRFW